MDQFPGKVRSLQNGFLYSYGQVSLTPPSYSSAHALYLHVRYDLIADMIRHHEAIFQLEHKLHKEPAGPEVYRNPIRRYHLPQFVSYPIPEDVRMYVVVSCDESQPCMDDLKADIQAIIKQEVERIRPELKAYAQNHGLATLPEWQRKAYLHNGPSLVNRPGK